MAELFDLRPQTLDIIVPAGDSVSLKMTLSDPLSFAGLDNWSAQVRASLSSVEDPPPDATFTVTPHDDGVFLTLTPEDTRTLWALRPVSVSTSAGNEFDPSRPFDASLEDSYTGSWDAQVSSDDDSVVLTIVAGTVTVTSDVTRAEV